MEDTVCLELIRHKDSSVSINKISDSVQLFILDTVKLAVIQQQSVLNEECDILGGEVKTYSNPPTYFQGVRTPNLRIYTLSFTMVAGLLGACLRRRRTPT